MCGIAGVIGSPALSDAVVRGMLRAMQHRGPDGSGMWQDRLSGARAVVLGHRRLAILDLSDSGAQPMVNVTGRFVLSGGGAAEQSGWFTIVWMRTTEGWRAVHDHSS